MITEFALIKQSNYHPQNTAKSLDGNQTCTGSRLVNDNHQLVENINKLTTELETCKNRLNNIESGINYDSTHHCALLSTIEHNETNNVDNSKPITKVLNYQRVERRTNEAPNQSSKSIKVKTKAPTISTKKQALIVLDDSVNPNDCHCLNDKAPVHEVSMVSIEIADERVSEAEQHNITNNLPTTITDNSTIIIADECVSEVDKHNITNNVPTTSVNNTIIMTDEREWLGHLPLIEAPNNTTNNLPTTITDNSIIADECVSEVDKHNITNNVPATTVNNTIIVNDEREWLGHLPLIEAPNPAPSKNLLYESTFRSRYNPEAPHQQFHKNKYNNRCIRKGQNFKRPVIHRNNPITPHFRWDQTKYHPPLRSERLTQSLEWETSPTIYPIKVVSGRIREQITGAKLRSNPHNLINVTLENPLKAGPLPNLIDTQVSNSMTMSSSDTEILPSQGLMSTHPKFFLSNVRSISNKVDDFDVVVQRNGIDFAGIIETWLNPSIPDSCINIHDFNLVRKDRSGQRRGGVCAFVKSKIPFLPLPDLCCPDHETLWLELN
ncbi:Hypothetical predicted protein [Paramuricea clavata]|uniref:Uncharacterized protein n=1 Tax=Paramuricea clavata TaxID=317549 RepID=A0A7D9KEK6_PARCT|nr:Hypothetical predicted protein [Paramuricea clavata]